MKQLAAAIVAWCVATGGGLIAPSGVAAQARPIIDLALAAPTSGSISYDGVNGPLYGNNLQVDSVVGLNTPLRDNQTRNCIGCVLTFVTGPLTSTDSTNWYFSAGGSLLLKGGVDLDDNGTLNAGDIPAGSTILEGSFIDTPLVTYFGGTFRVLGGGLMDTKHPSLTAFYGMPSVTYDGGFNLSFNATTRPPSGFESRLVYSGDLYNAGDLETPTPTTSPTDTVPAATDTPTATPSASASNTPTSTATAVVPTATPTDTSTAAPTDTPGGPTNTPTNSPTDTATASPTNSPAPPTDTPTTTFTATTTSTPPPTSTPTPPPPSATPTATPDCGNGIVETGEECDDGNPFSGDGCEPSCVVSAQCNFFQPPGNQIYVNDNNSDGSAARCATPDFADIQSAINSASDGDQIFICPGTYTQPVIVTQELDIESTDGAAVTILHTAAVITLDLRRSATRIQGLTLIADNANVIDANQICPIAQPGCANPGHGSNLVIANNIIKNSPEGIDWSGRIDCVDIIDNAFADNGKHILIDHLVSNGGASILVNIASNMVDRGGMVGMPGITVLGNEAIIEKNQIRDAVKDALLTGTATLTIRLNQIERSGDDAIVVQSDGIVCARVPPGGMPRPCLQILENNLYTNTSDGIRVKDGQQTVDTGIHCNNFEQNGVGLGNEAASGQLDATLNWWGSNTGPSGVYTGTGDKIENRSGATTLFIEFLCGPCPIGVASVNGVCTLISISPQFPGHDPDVDPAGKRIGFVSTHDLDNDPRTSITNAAAREEVFLLIRQYPVKLGDKKVCGGTNPPADSCGLCIGGTRPLQACITDVDCPANLATDPIILNGDCVLFTQVTKNPNIINGFSKSPRLSFHGDHVFFESPDNLLGSNPSGVLQTYHFNNKVFINGGSPLSMLTNGAAGQDSDLADMHLRHVVVESMSDPAGTNGDHNSEIFQYDNRRQKWYQLTYTLPPFSNLRPVGRKGKRVLFDSDADLDNDPKTTINNVDGNREIFLARRGRKSIRITQLTDTVAPVENRAGGLGFHDRLAVFASNGNFTRQNDDGNFEIFTVLKGAFTQITVSIGGENVFPVMNGRGRFIAFESTADLMSDGATNRRVFFFDRDRNALTQLSRSSVGDNQHPRISNGRFVVWDSDVDLTTNPPTMLPDRVVYLFDRQQDD